MAAADWYKKLRVIGRRNSIFDSIQTELNQVSAQAVASGYKSWHLGNLGYWGGGPLTESSRHRQELRPFGKKHQKNFPSVWPRWFKQEHPSRINRTPPYMHVHISHIWQKILINFVLILNNLMRILQLVCIRNQGLYLGKLKKWRWLGIGISFPSTIMGSSIAGLARPARNPINSVCKLDKLASMRRLISSMSISGITVPCNLSEWWPRFS